MNTVKYIYYYNEEYLEIYLKISFEKLENRFFYFENIHSIEKDTLKDWDLHYTKPTILGYS